MSAFNAALSHGHEHRASRSGRPSCRRCLLAIAALAWTGVACSSVTDVDPTTDRIEVSPSTLTLEVGQSATLSAEAFDENGVNLTYGTVASGLPVRFEWTSRGAAYVEVDPSGHTVTVRGLQEYVDGGSTGWITVEARVQGRSLPVGTARVQVMPVDNIQVSPSPIEIQVGASATVTAEATVSTGTVVTVPTTWSLADGALASIVADGGSNAATITGITPGTTTLRAIAGTKESGPVTVAVVEAPPEQGNLEGTVRDHGGSAVAGLVVRIGGATPQRTVTDVAGRYSATGLTAGAYTVYVQGVSGLRFLSTEVHEVGVQAGSTTVEDITTAEGNFLEVLDGSGDRQAEAGASVSVDLDLRAWNRSGCPLCAPALILGIAGDPVVLYPLGTPGPTPGVQIATSLSFTAPGLPGDYPLYAMLVTGISTGSEEGRDLARSAYRDRYGDGSSNGLWTETFIPIGTLTVPLTPTQDTYTRAAFVTVPDPVEIDLDAAGNLYVANSGVSTGGAGDAAYVRRVTPSGDIDDFGVPIPDPDALIVDRAGEISSLGAGAVLVGGALNASNTENRITEISNDGLVTQTLVEGDETVLMNPASFAFLSSGDLLIGNYGTNSVTVLRKGSLQLEAFHMDPTAPNGLSSMVALDGVVYVITGSKMLTALNENGALITEDLWPTGQSTLPGRLAADISGLQYDGDLLVSTLDGHILRMDVGTGSWAALGDLSFSMGVCSMAVSPTDGTLFVAECDGQVWKVTKS